MQEDERRNRQIESAGRCLAAALVEPDGKLLAALLRCAARYVDGDDAQAGHLGVVAMPNRQAR